MSCIIPALYLVGPGFRLGQGIGPSEIYRRLPQSFRENPCRLSPIGHYIFLARTFEFSVTSLYQLTASVNEQCSYSSLNKYISETNYTPPSPIMYPYVGTPLFMGVTLWGGGGGAGGEANAFPIFFLRSIFGNGIEKGQTKKQIFYKL